MEIQRLGVMKSEFRKSMAEAFKGFLVFLGCLRPSTLASGFGLRVSFGIRNWAFGFAPSLGLSETLDL